MSLFRIVAAVTPRNTDCCLLRPAFALKDFTLLPQKLLTAEAIIAASQNAIAADYSFTTPCSSLKPDLSAVAAPFDRDRLLVPIGLELELGLRPTLHPTERSNQAQTVALVLNKGSWCMLAAIWNPAGVLLHKTHRLACDDALPHLLADCEAHTIIESLRFITYIHFTCHHTQTVTFESLGPFHNAQGSARVRAQTSNSHLGLLNAVDRHTNLV